MYEGVQGGPDPAQRLVPAEDLHDFAGAARGDGKAGHGDADGSARAYVETLLAQPDFIAWGEDALTNAA